MHELLRRPQVHYQNLMTLPNTAPETLLTSEAAEQVEILTKYQGYIDRQNEEVSKLRDLEHLTLPKNFDYNAVRGLSTEVIQKLNQHQPETVGQASRISGITPAAVALLTVHVKRGIHSNQTE